MVDFPASQWWVSQPTEVEQLKAENQLSFEMEIPVEEAIMASGEPLVTLLGDILNSVPHQNESDSLEIVLQSWFSEGKSCYQIFSPNVNPKNNVGFFHGFFKLRRKPSILRSQIVIE